MEDKTNNQVSKSTLVYVIGVDGLPLDPTHPAKARILLKNGKAKVKKKTTFYHKTKLRNQRT